MTIRRRRLWFVLIAGVAMAFVFCVVFGKSLYITDSQMTQIKVGMTLAEVEAIFGKPHDLKHAVLRMYRWETWTGTVMVSIENDGTVAPMTQQGFPVSLAVIHVSADDPWDLWIGRIRRKLGW